MKQNNIPDLPRLKGESFENIFNVFEDTETSLYYYNLLQTINFPPNLPDGYFTLYTVAIGDSWPFISYKVYENPNIWWVILIANKIQNPIDPLIPGTILKIPRQEVLRTILTQIKTQTK